MNCSHLQKKISLTSVPKQLPMICRRHQDLKTYSENLNFTWDNIKSIQNFISTSENFFTPKLDKNVKKNASPLWNTSLLFVFIVVSRPPKPRNWDLLTMAACQAIWIHLVVWDGLGYHQIWWKQADDGSWWLQKTHLKKFAQVKVDHSLTLILYVRCLKIWWT